MTCNCCPPNAELLQLILTWGVIVLVVSGLGDGWAAVEVSSSEAAQLPTSCTVHCSFGWRNSAPLQPLTIESIAFNLLVTESSVWPFDAATFRLLISVRVSLLRWQTTSWLVLKLLCHLLMVVKCGSGNLQQLKVSFSPNNVRGNKTRALLPRQCYHCLLCSLQVLFWSWEHG